ncbi:hypothetical protein L204_105574 [Cryptococcus depauperatus]|nr:hypothetical protein L204_02656 [Cryptococcus depauperatus CBS 7855]
MSVVHRTRQSSMSLGCGAVAMFIGTLFYWLSAFSTPFINGIYYVHTRENDVKFGNFGWCAGRNVLTGYPFEVCYQHVGYLFKPWIPGNQHTTGALLLVALTAAFGTLAFFSLLHSALDLKSGACSFFLTMLTTLLATISFLAVIIIFGVAHHRFKDDHLDPHYGAGLVLVIIGWLCFMLTPPLVLVGWFKERRYRTRPDSY